MKLLTSVDWNTLLSDDQLESSFLESFLKFNLSLPTDNHFFQRDKFLTDNLFLCNNFETNQSFSNHPAFFCRIIFEIETEQINLNRYCIRKQTPNHCVCFS